MTDLVAALSVGGGLAVLVVGLLLRARERQEELRRVVGVPFAEEDLAEELAADGGLAEHTGLLDPGIRRVTEAVDELEVSDRIARSLELARIALHPGELLLLIAAGGVATGLWVWALTGQVLLGVGALAAAPALATVVVQRRVDSRRREMETALPDALSLVASSLAAGHSFQRALQMFVDQADGALAEELERALVEAQLGRPLVDSLDRTAERVGREDLAWVVEAVRIQQRVGGRLGELLHTLADYMRAREELRGEVKALTAEGRMSAWILAGLPVAMALAMQAMNPGYLDPLMSGLGLVMLVAGGVGVVLGLVTIRRMVAKVSL